MSEEKETLSYQDFVGEILEQLYKNRQVHKDHQTKGLAYMFMVCAEQLGQLGYAIATKDLGRARLEVAHVAAVLYEIYERIVARLRKNEPEQ